MSDKLTKDETSRGRWSPIETAAHSEGVKIICASIREDKVCWVRYGMWSDQWQRFWDGVEPSGFNNLTHWMPMPEILQKSGSVFSYNYGLN